MIRFSLCVVAVAVCLLCAIGQADEPSTLPAAAPATQPSPKDPKAQLELAQARLRVTRQVFNDRLAKNPDYQAAKAKVDAADARLADARASSDADAVGKAAADKLAARNELSALQKPLEDRDAELRPATSQVSELLRLIGEADIATKAQSTPTIDHDALDRARQHWQKIRLDPNKAGEAAIWSDYIVRLEHGAPRDLTIDPPPAPPFVMKAGIKLADALRGLGIEKCPPPVSQSESDTVYQLTGELVVVGQTPGFWKPIFSATIYIVHVNPDGIITDFSRVQDVPR